MALERERKEKKGPGKKATLRVMRRRQRTELGREGGEEVLYGKNVLVIGGGSKVKARHSQRDEPGV